MFSEQINDLLIVEFDVGNSDRDQTITSAFLDLVEYLCNDAGNNTQTVLFGKSGNSSTHCKSLSALVKKEVLPV